MNYAENLLDIPNIDAPIYRVYSKSRLLELLKTNKNGLVRPKKWDDPFENFFLRSTVESPTGELVTLEIIEKYFYGQCWTYNEESDAMWRIYSHSKDGIKVRTSVRKLFESFYKQTTTYPALHSFIGNVNYVTESEIIDMMAYTTFEQITFGGQPTGMAKMLCLKREAFQHEQEVRLIYYDVVAGRGDGNVALFDFDVNSICDEIVLDPRLTDDDAVLLTNELKALGCSLEIKKSTLYRVPKFKLKL